MVVKKKLIRIIAIFLILSASAIIFLMKARSSRLSYTSVTASPISTKSNNNQLNTLPVTINAERNFFDTAVYFKVDKDTLIHIRCVGEGADHLINPYLFKSYENDGVEVFFDMKNEKKPFFDLHQDDRQYRFLWKTLKIDGQNINLFGVKVIEIDPDNTDYIMQVCFPWRSLGFVVPETGAKFGFDIALIDCDGGTRKALVTWNSTSEDSWKNTSFYGTAVLSNINASRQSSIVNCLFTNKVIGFNRYQESEWRKALSYKFKNVVVGSVRDSLDLSGEFKAMWDSQNLYILVKVRDDIKTYAKAMFDYGWIEDRNRRPVWKMDLEHTKPAGGALKNRIADTIIRIPKGIYTLRYKTDESHSPAQWDSQSPIDPFYGIKIAY